MRQSTNRCFRRARLTMSLILLTSWGIGEETGLGEEPRLNQIQVIGTHNSYHIAPTPAAMKLIASASRDAAPKLDYTHRTLEEQFGSLGIRQIELDVFADPDGGLYAKPMAYRVVNSLENGAAGPDPDADGSLMKPGFKILHVPDIDYATTVKTLHDGLQRIRKWSLDHPAHIPLFVLVELKDEPIVGLTQPVKFSPQLLDELDAAIQGCLDKKHVITPDVVRKSRETLREAVLEDGWPRLEECRGRVLFALDNEGAIRDDYLAGHPSLANRMMFVSGKSSEGPEAAFFKINDPIRNHAEIQRLVKQGFLVRTRADADTQEARKNETHRRELAFSSGAQMISTDYPQPDLRFSDYVVRFAEDRAVRSNPIHFASPVDIDDIRSDK